MASIHHRRRRLLRLTTAVVMAIAGLSLWMPTPAFATPGPFVCQPGFYQVISGQLKELNPLTGAYVAIGSPNPSYNAIGYDTVDNYLYGLSISNNHLLRIANDGSITDLGLPTGLPTGNTIVSGDFDDSGHLIVQSGATDFYSIDVSTVTAAHFTVTGSTTGQTKDMVWIGGTIYSVYGPTLYSVNLSTDVETSRTVSGLPAGTDAFGAGWSDRPDELFYSDNVTGFIYRLTNFTTASPTATQVSTGTTTNSNDGAACKNADSPFNIPTAADDAYSATTDATLNVNAANGVLANDIGSQLQAAVQTGPTHGTLTLNTDGSFVYHPNVGFTGHDSFTYNATDQYGRTSTSPATVSLTVSLPAVPHAADDTYTTTTGSNLTKAAAAGLLANDTGAMVGVTGNTSPQHGSVTVNSDGSLTYTPDTGFSGSDTFAYTIADHYLRTSTAHVTVIVTPTAVADSYNGPAGQALTVAAGSGVLSNDIGSGLSAALAAGPSHGTLTLAGDGSFTYTPDNGFSGADSFSYTAADDTSTSPSVTVSLILAPPTGPVATDDSYQAASDTITTVTAAAGLLGNDTGSDIHVTSHTDGGHGSVTVGADGGFAYTPDTHYFGPDEFTYTVTDQYGQVSGTATVHLDVQRPAGPVAADDSYQPVAGVVLTKGPGAGLLANDTGDGIAAGVVTQPVHGSVTVQPDGSFVWTPDDSGFSGTDSFRYSITDDYAQTDTALVSLTVHPKAVDDSFAADAGEVLDDPSLDVLTNDTGSDLTATLVSPPAHGSLTLRADGTFAYHPDAGFSGSDTFTYTDGDGTSTSDVATVHLEVAAPPPPVATPDSYQATAGVTLAVAAAGVLVNDTGSGLTAVLDTTASHGALTLYPDGGFTYVPTSGYHGSDSFTYHLVDRYGQPSDPVSVAIAVTLPPAPTAVDHTFTTSSGVPVVQGAGAGLLLGDTGTTTAVSGTSAPAHGSVTESPNGSFTFTPDAGYSGADAFEYTITDAFGRTATAVVSIMIHPTAQPDGYSTVSDHPLVVPAAQGVLRNDAGTDLVVSLVDAPAHGMVVLAGDGSFRYVPDSGYTGPDSFTYSANDGTSSTGTATVDLEVTPDTTPTATSDSYTTSTGTMLHVGVSHGVLTNDIGAVITVTRYTQPTHGTVTLDVDGAFTYQPDPGYAGPDSFEYTVTDEDGQTAIAEVLLTVIRPEAAPVATPDDYDTAAGTTLTVSSGQGPMSDDRGDTLTITDTTAPGHGRLTMQPDGAFEYVPATGFSGRDHCRYTVTDIAGLTSAARLTFTVTPTARPHSYRTREGRALHVSASEGVLDEADGLLLRATSDGANHGRLTVRPDGSFTYLPDSGYSGPDRFTFTATDRSSQAVTSTVRLTVTPRKRTGSVTPPSRPAGPNPIATSPTSRHRARNAPTGAPDGLSSTGYDTNRYILTGIGCFGLGVVLLLLGLARRRRSIPVVTRP